MADSTLGELADDPKLRALIKPEAIWEIETGRKQTGKGIWNASVERSAWVQALNKLFESYDYLLLPTASVFPFDAKTHWPATVAGQKMDTYHHWMDIAVGGWPRNASAASLSPTGQPSV